MAEYRFDVCGDVVTLLTKVAGAFDASPDDWGDVLNLIDECPSYSYSFDNFWVRAEKNSIIFTSKETGESARFRADEFRTALQSAIAQQREAASIDEPNIYLSGQEASATIDLIKEHGSISLQSVLAKLKAIC